MTHYDLQHSMHAEETKKTWDESAKETEACMAYGKKKLEEGKKRTINEGWRENEKYKLEL